MNKSTNVFSDYQIWVGYLLTKVVHVFTHINWFDRWFPLNWRCKTWQGRLVKCLLIPTALPLWASLSTVAALSGLFLSLGLVLLGFLCLLPVWLYSYVRYGREEDRTQPAEDGHSEHCICLDCMSKEASENPRSDMKTTRCGLDEQDEVYPYLLKCPKCGGQGILSKPPWVPGDVHEWSSSTTTPHQCDVCRGASVIWSKPGNS